MVIWSFLDMESEWKFAVDTMKHTATDYQRDWKGKIWFPKLSTLGTLEDLDEAELGGNLTWWEPQSHYGRLASYRRLPQSEDWRFFEMLCNQRFWR